MASHPFAPHAYGTLTVALASLRLQDNSIPGTIPQTIGNLVRLRYLDLYNNRMVGDVRSRHAT
jgi:hypothetical protein